MFLITTADENTWKKDEKIIFLGEWCKRYSRNQLWSTLNYEVLPYHWDDRDRLYNDYKYLENVYERYLRFIATRLNELHECDHSLRYWRILIGSWLRYFVDILFDRYLSIKAAGNLGNVSLTWLMKENLFQWTPNNFAEFRVNILSDRWNHIIYGEIIKHLNIIPFTIIDKFFEPIYSQNQVKRYSLLKQLIKYSIMKYNKMLPDKWKSIFFINSVLPVKELFKLQITLGQAPNPIDFLVSPVNLPVMSVDQLLRKQLVIDQANNVFENILEKLIPQLMPKAHFEGYKKNRNIALDAYPKSVKLVYTANAYSFDEAFKIWAAESIEKGANLLLGQHGGRTGVSRFGQSLDHQVKISDRYYSWGWQDIDNKKIKPLSGNRLISIDKTLSPQSNGQILCVLPVYRRYYYYHSSMPLASQYWEHINDQIIFAKSVTDHVFGLLRFRMAPRGGDWDAKQIFKDHGLETVIDKSEQNFIKRANEVRLCISTDNSTVILETMAANFPTLAFWNPKYYELSPEAQPYYDDLHRVGILHYSPESAAAKINKIYDDTISWWNQPEIQEVREKFCYQFAYSGENWLKEWKTEMKSLID